MPGAEQLRWSEPSLCFIVISGHFLVKTSSKISGSTIKTRLGNGEMIRSILLGVAFLGLAACASNPPETAASAPEASTASTTASATLAGTAVPTATATAEATAPPMAAGTTPEGEDGIHVVAVPTVAKTTPPVVASNEDHPEKVKCKRERITGSHRMTRVCRTVAQIEADREAGRSMVQGLNSSPQAAPRSQ